MRAITVEKALYWIVRMGAYTLPFTLLLITHSAFFPFISGKGFIFRIIVEIIVAAWVGLLVIDVKKYWPRWSFVSGALTVFVGIIFVTSIFGVDFSNSFWSNFERMEGIALYLHLLLLFFALTGAFHTRKEWATLFGVSIFTSVLVAFYGVLEATGEITSFGDSSRIISTLGNPLYVAAYLSFHIFLSAFLWLQTKSSEVRWLLGGVVIFETIVFLITGARGAFIGILAGIGITMLLLLINAGSRKVKFIFGIIIAILCITPFALYTLRDTSFIRESGPFSRFSSITLNAGEARFTLWKMAFEAFKERPVLGWGAGNFIVPFTKHYDPWMVTQEPWFDRTHNMPLEWLVAGGLVGFLAYLTLFFSIIPALKQGVKQNLIENKESFVFIGMFISYAVQLLFVFDTQSTYLMLILMLGFLHAASSHSREVWFQKNTFILFADGSVRPENLSTHKLQSRKSRRALGIRLENDANSQTLSLLKAGAIASSFTLSFLLVWMINIKPFRANLVLMDAFSLFRGQKFVEAGEAFKKALKLSEGTIGTEEVREHITFNIYELFQNPEYMKKPGGEAMYQLAVDEMEKQIATNSQKDLKIKQNILLAQLYHQQATFSKDRRVFEKAFEQYNLSLQYAPNYVSIYPIVANLYAQIGDLQAAIGLTEKATSLLAGAGRYDARTFYSNALFYTAAKRYDDAYRALKEINDVYSSGGGLDAEMMGNIILATRSSADSIPFLEKVYSIDKNLVDAVLMLAQLYATEKNMDKARFYAQEALRINPSAKEKVQQFLEALPKK